MAEMVCVLSMALLLRIELRSYTSNSAFDAASENLAGSVRYLRQKYSR